MVINIQKTMKVQLLLYALVVSVLGHQLKSPDQCKYSPSNMDSGLQVCIISSVNKFKQEKSWTQKHYDCGNGLPGVTLKSEGENWSTPQDCTNGLSGCLDGAASTGSYKAWGHDTATLAKCQFQYWVDGH
ncbi:hypothetical protein BC940DRAFT_305061 [Gongronella butleri]|nr:hypothetical protein BC940DRAFT_305061 [Gongronella butleri]